MRGARVASFTLPVLLFGCALEPSGEPVFRESTALKGAQAAPEAQQVVAIVNFAGGQCSGVPITRDLLLTARHCIGPTADVSRRVDCAESVFTDPDSAGAMFVVSTPEITDRVEDYRAVSEFTALPGDDSRLCGRDLALLRLKEALDVPPLVPRVDEPVVPGEPYTAYGYGDDEAELGSGIRRRLEGLTVSCVGLSCKDAEVFESEWVGSNGVCSGDSGGPALDGEGRILGIVSRGATGCRSPVYESVAAFSDFLKSEARRAAREGKYEPPAWAQDPQASREPLSDESTLEASCAVRRGAGGAAWTTLVAMLGAWLFVRRRVLLR